VAVDESRQDRCEAQVDDAAPAGSSPWTRTHVGDAIAGHDDHLILQIGADFGIEQPAARMATVCACALCANAAPRRPETTSRMNLGCME
jgi:hypothetical protein